ncbi:MAG: SDR family NAD(P)-dependent oxidoreductase [Gemmatimonadales bacterium]|nr:SDR family NAD(P)-dependent oxidoreductase [Gemmatimonadales bacterium]
MSSTLRLLALGALAGWTAMKLLRDDRDSFSFDGKTVLITGGSRGLGLVLARDAAAAGARVAICGRDPEALERARATLERIGATVVAVQADVTQPDAVRELIDAVAARLGPIDMLINNAGVIEVGPAETMTVSDYEEAMATNFWGMVYPTLQVLPSMRERGGGRIVNITSIGGKLGIPHLLPYSASKFAALGFSQGLRAAVAGDDVSVTTAIPGLMRTGSPRNAIFRGKHRAEYAWFSIADALPGLSVSADQASRRILSAACRGDPEVLFPAVARLAVIASAVAPHLTASALTLANRLLPGAPAARTGRKRGKDSQSGLSPSWLSKRGDEAARRHNQVAPAEGSRA